VTWPNPDRRASTVSGDTLQFLREFAGQKFTAEELAARIDHDEKQVFRTLVARYHDGRYGLRRERGWGFKFRWWVIEVGEFAAAGEERAIAKWMTKHRIAARPSQIAAGVHLEISEVAKILERWNGDFAVIRCELPLRSGCDRFEYRLAHAPALSYNGLHPRGSREDRDEEVTA
jgi:hypothetical protein